MYSVGQGDLEGFTIPHMSPAWQPATQGILHIKYNTYLLDDRAQTIALSDLKRWKQLPVYWKACCQ